MTPSMLHHQWRLGTSLYLCQTNVHARDLHRGSLNRRIYCAVLPLVRLRSARPGVSFTCRLNRDEWNFLFLEEIVRAPCCVTSTTYAGKYMSRKFGSCLLL